VLGKSSGGYMAKTLFEEGLFDYGIYVAPVLDPHKRGTLIPKLGKTARSFFKTRPPALTKWNANRELLLLASNDENVPKSCFTHEQLKHAIYLGPKTHQGMIWSVSAKFVSTVMQFIHK
jgi:hypothetical protein